jgi:hypothetical protein
VLEADEQPFNLARTDLGSRHIEWRPAAQGHVGPSRPGPGSVSLSPSCKPTANSKTRATRSSLSDSSWFNLPRALRRVRVRCVIWTRAASCSRVHSVALWSRTKESQANPTSTLFADASLSRAWRPKTLPYESASSGSARPMSPDKTTDAEIRGFLPLTLYSTLSPHGYLASSDMSGGPTWEAAGQGTPKRPGEGALWLASVSWTPARLPRCNRRGRLRRTAGNRSDRRT